jgi:endo-1,4-beta-xylanase
MPQLSLGSLFLLTGLTAQAQTPVTLKDAFQGIFRIGAAVNQPQFGEQDARGVSIIQAQFNTISPENVLKWESVHPRPNGYAFDAPDRYVAFGEKNGMFVIGHTLVWHNQTPRWVFQDDKGAPLDRDRLLQRMREHIQTVVGRYRGRIGGWDVVNEALNEDGTLRQSPWLTIIGEDYLVKAFEYAREADPKAELYYNDYSLENPPKRDGAVKLIRKLQAGGAKVTAVGLQGHDKMTRPTLEEQEEAIVAFERLGIKVNITELDIDVLPPATQQRTAEVTLTVDAKAKLDPYAAGLPDAVQQALARRYSDLFGVFLKHRGAIARITFWGVTDADSWLNNWPVRGRTSYPLLFDRQGKPKPAYDAVVKAAAK